MTVENDDYSSEIPVYQTDEELKDEFIRLAKKADEKIAELENIKPTYEQMNRMYGPGTLIDDLGPDVL